MEPLIAGGLEVGGTCDCWGLGMVDEQEPRG